MIPGPVTVQTRERLDLIEGRAQSMLRFTARCHELLDKGLAVDVDGVPSHELIYQYMQLVAQNAGLVKVQADSLVGLLEELRK